MHETQTEIFKLMQKLNAKEKRAVRVFRICTHAYFTSQEIMLLDFRWPRQQCSSAFYEATELVEQLNWKRWYDEAKKAGLRR